MTTDQSLLDQFWVLTSAGEAQQLQAAYKIISRLQSKVILVYLHNCSKARVLSDVEPSYTGYNFRYTITSI